MLVLDESKPELFEFSIGKKQYAIPHVRSLPYPEYRKLLAAVRAADGNAPMVEAVIDLIERHAPGSTSALTVSQADQLVTAYMGGGAGE